jgi:isoquinoline 1-oxidoreductase beta subunit
MNELELDRRTFLVSAAAFAGGMSLSLLPAPLRALAQSSGIAPAKRDAELSPWIVIAPDDTVIVRSPTPEIGNGAMTQVAMNVAEELGCDWSKVRVESASPNRDYIEKGVYSVGFLPFFGGHGTDHDRMKHALQLGASGRERLKAVAAARWKVPRADVEARNSVLTHKASGRALRYGEVAGEAATIKLPAEPELKPQSDWTLLGKTPPPKLQAPDIAKGAAVYGIDVRLPGMVHAAVMHSPVHGGQLRHHDPAAVLKMPGVRAVVVVDLAKTKGSPVQTRSSYGMQSTAAQSAVAVIADHYWQARKALEALPVEWDSGPGGAKTTADLYGTARATLNQPPQKVLCDIGNVSTVSASKLIEAEYLTPFCENAPIEPLNGMALVTADKVEVWHPCQDAQQAFWVAVDETGLAPEKVEIHQTLVGGGFGRRTQADDVRMVVAIAKEYPGVPVKVIWSREEMTRQGRYRTLIASRFKARLDEKGMLQGLDAHAYMAGLAQQGPVMLVMGYGDSPYLISGGIPNVRLAVTTAQPHLLTGAYRAPSFNSFTFMVDSFIDECAMAANVDPLEYRLKLLEKWDPAWSQCLKIAAQKAGWGRQLPKGQGLGIGIGNFPFSGLRQAGTTVCAVARVEVSREGVLAVKQVDVTFDSGRVANRDAAAAQIEGGTIFGLNMTLNEEITLAKGAVVESNFHDYPVLRIGEVPKINIHFDALSGHDRFGMIGEVPVGPIGPAVGNAIFQATGKRLRTTPFRKLDMSWT